MRSSDRDKLLIISMQLSATAVPTPHLLLPFPAHQPSPH